MGCEHVNVTAVVHCGQKGALDPLELELQVVAGIQMGAGNYAQVLYRSST